MTRDDTDPTGGSLEEQLATSRAHLRMVLDVFDQTDDLMVLLDGDGRPLHLNAAARRFYGIADPAVGIPDSWRPTTEGLDELVARITGSGSEVDRWSAEVTARRVDGVGVPMSVQVIAHREEPRGPVEFYSAVARDISDRAELEASLQRAATHDPLTGLPNRALLVERIGRALDGLRHSGGDHAVALLFVDLDRFKSVNDSLGHELGDAILVEAARCLSDLVRPGDTVARFGGDEFVVLCERLDDPGDAMVIAERIDSALGGFLSVEGRQVRVGVSIGISFADAQDADAAAVLRDADAAMYKAKTSGRGRWVVFDDDLRAAVVRRRGTEQALREALDAGELDLVHQPMVDLSTGRVAGFEALLRWRRGDGTVPPEEFVPVAEETGLIVAVGRWALEEAVARGARWQTRSGRDDLEIAVNVSARQLQSPGFIEDVARILEDSGLAAGTLALEITESILLEDLVAAGERLDALRSLGVRLALDDFGTGYSSLTYLCRFPVDTVKLDQSFVREMDGSPGDAAIVAAVIDLAHALGKRCVAEGVGSHEQLEHLRGLGCDLGQGYYFSEPLAASDVPEVLRSGS